MKHLYIFDYGDENIYHTTIPEPENISDSIEEYITTTLKFDLRYIEYMLTKEEKDIKEIEL